MFHAGRLTGLGLLYGVLACWAAVYAVAAEREQATPPDIADVPSQEFTVKDNARMRYFLVGPRKGVRAPRDGFRLIVVLPGGDGGAAFNPFVRRLYKYAMDDTFIVAQPLAFKWRPSQWIVWPTRVNRVADQEFATEDFVEAVVNDVKRRHRVDPRSVFTLSWSSGGPAGYAISLAEKTAVTGSYVLMSVYRRPWLPPSARARGRVYLIEHSPTDRVCPFSHAKQAERELTQAGATVRLVTYQGGHGWRGRIYDRVRRGVAWLVDQTQCRGAPATAPGSRRTSD